MLANAVVDVAPSRSRVLSISTDMSPLKTPLMSNDDEKGLTLHERKLRRNARDRKRSQLKKDTMETMRVQLKQLEAEKKRLEQRFPVSSSSSSSSSPQSLALSTISKASDSNATRERLHLAQSKYRAVLQQLEQLREANRAMALDVLQRDLFRSAAQNLIDTLHNPDDDSNTTTSQQPHPSLPPPMPEQDALEFALQVTRLITSARLECSHMQPFTGARVCGWSDFRCQTGATIKFTIQKIFTNQSAAVLAQRMWQILSDSAQLKRVLKPGLQCDLRLVQRVGDFALVLDRVTRDRQFEYDALPHTALRTTLMLVRATDRDVAPNQGENHVIGMKTIDRPAFKDALADNEAWCDIFYWFHFQDVAATSASASASPSTTVVLGGELSYCSEAFARAWFAELVFLAIRWETAAVAPVLLTV